MQAPEIDAHIAVSVSLTQKLWFNGTPSFEFETEIASGLLQLGQSKAIAAQVGSEYE